MGELLVGFTKSVIHIVWLHRIPHSLKLFNGSGMEVPSPSTGLIMGLQGGVTLPTLKRTYWITLKRPRQSVPESLWVEWVCLLVPSGRFYMSSNLPSPEGTCSGPSRFCTPCQFLYVVPTPLCRKAQFPWQIFFTDDCRFTREAVLNSRKSDVWDGSQQRFGINVWAVIVDGRLIGPYLLAPRLTGSHLPSCKK